MVDYEGFRSIIQGSNSYEFDGTKLILTGFYDGKEAVLDFGHMNERMFEELVEESTDNIEYSRAQSILAGSKEYTFENTDDLVISVSDYDTGDKVSFNLERIDADMYEELKAEEMYYDDFEDAVNALGKESEISL